MNLARIKAHRTLRGPNFTQIVYVMRIYGGHDSRKPAYMMMMIVIGKYYNHLRTQL